MIEKRDQHVICAPSNAHFILTLITANSDGDKIIQGLGLVSNKGVDKLSMLSGSCITVLLNGVLSQRFHT